MLNSEENKLQGRSDQRNPAKEQRTGKARPKKSKSAQPGKPEPDQLPEELVAARKAASEADQAIMIPADVNPVGSVAGSAETVPGNVPSLSKAYEDYTRKSFAQTMLFFEKLAGVRSLNKLVELQAEFVRQACDSLIADSHKMWALHREMAQHRLALFEELATKLFTPVYHPR